MYTKILYVALISLIVTSSAQAQVFLQSDFGKGAISTEVRGLQQLLLELGFFIYPQTTARYGDVTLQAVQAFQNSRCIESTGYVGPLTRSALSNLQSTNCLHVQAQALNEQVVLGLGSQGTYVAGLQKFLKDTGFFIYPELTSYFGKITEAALKAFQKSKSVPESGRTDVATQILFKVASGTQNTNTSSIVIPGGSTIANASITYFAGAGSGGGSGAPATSNSDTTAPVISGISATPSQTTATISWTTDENSDSDVAYGLTNAYGATTANLTLVTSHTVLLSGLTASTTYNYRVKSIDPAGNISLSPNQTFTTTAALDTTPPVISSVTPSVTNTTATITFTTNESATSSVSYGTTAGYGSISATGPLATAHTTNLSGLIPNTLYHFRVNTTDASGNTSTNSDATFTTASPALSFFETVTFGALSYGDAPVTKVASAIPATSCSIISGNAAGHFAIDNSCNVSLTPQGQGSLVGQYVLHVRVVGAGTTDGQLTINLDPSRYDVGTNAQITTVMANTGGTLSGKTVALHAGNYSPITVNKTGVTAELKFINAETEKPVVDTIAIQATDNITIDGLKITMSAWPKTNATVQSLVNFAGVINNFKIKNSELWHGYGPSHLDIDPLFAYPEYTAPAGEGMGAKLAYAFQGDGAVRSNFTFEDNYIHDVHNAFKGNAQNGYTRIVGNTVVRAYEDSLSVGTFGTTVPSEVTVAWNTFSSHFAKSTDTGNPHSDCAQFFGNDNALPYTASNWSNINIYGNIFFPGTTRGDGCQSVFLSDMPAGTYFIPNITGNLLLGRSGHAISIRDAKNSYIFGNTAVAPDPIDITNVNTQTLNIGTGSNAGDQFIGGNIAEAVGSYGTADTASFPNLVIGQKGALTPFTAVFAGSIFNPQSKLDALSMFAPKAGGLATLGIKGAIGNGYVDFINRVIDRTLEPSFVYFGAVSGAPLSTQINSNISMIRGGVNGRTASVSGSATPEFRICGDEACTSIIRDWGTTSTPVNPGQFAQLRAMSSSTGSTTTSSALTIGSQSYVFQINTASVLSFSTVTFDGVATPPATTPDFLKKTAGLNLSEATATSSTSGGSVTGLTITSGGQWYEPNTQNQLNFTGSNTTPAAGYAVDTNDDGILDQIVITDGGSGYASAPTVTVQRNTQKFIFAIKAKLGNATSLDYIFQQSGSGLSALMLPLNKVRFQAGSSFSIDTTSGLSSTTAQTLLCSVDLAQPSFVLGVKCYIDGVNVTPGVGTFVTSSNKNMSNNGVLNTSIFSNVSGTANFLEGDVDFIYFAYGRAAIDSTTGVILDMSDPIVRNRFTADNINLTNGTGPTSRQPQLFMTGDAATWNAGTNKGTGGVFTVGGVLQ